MWSEIPVLEATLDCAPPFSFYFDLLEVYWKAPTNTLPLHRLCTLARKQGANYVAVESGVARPAIRLELDAIDRAHGGGGAAEAVVFSFFGGPASPDDIIAVGAADFLGQAVLINYQAPGAAGFTASYIFEAILPPPGLKARDGSLRPLLNNFVYTETELEVEVKNRKFSVAGVYYCQQNGSTHVCAHASLRMALTSKVNNKVTAEYINSLLGVVPPCSGLQFGQMIQVIEDQGLYAEIIDCTTPSLTRENYISALAAAVESGDKALLVFTTDTAGTGAPSTEEHVVLVFGHTRHSDEWHPQAIPAYSGPRSAPYYPASGWIDHFLIHDDNFGPYFTLSSSALEFKPSVRAHWIVIIRDVKISHTSQFAEGLAATTLASTLKTFRGVPAGKWLTFIAERERTFILRTLLLRRDEYMLHLANAVGHDGSKMSSQELDPLTALPNLFWMVEFSLPPLFTGNHSKLGEILIAADAPGVSAFNELTLGMRGPEFLFIKDAASLQLVRHPSSIEAHVPIYRVKEHDHVW